MQTHPAATALHAATDKQQNLTKSVTKCARLGNSGLQYGIVQKVKKTTDSDYWLVIIIKFYCINKVFRIWVGFDYFDVNISIYLWHRLLTLVVGSASIMLADSAKQASLVGYGGSYLPKPLPVAIFFKIEH